MVINPDKLLAARRVLWYGSADIYVTGTFKDPITKQTKSNIKTLLHQNISCHLSRKTKDESNDNDKNSVVNHTIKLSLPNTINIPAGSEIVVTQNGKTETFRYSGYSSQYIVHQEIILTLMEQYA